MTKRIAISELEGAALDWAVASSIGKEVEVKEVYNRGPHVRSLSSMLLFQPSTEWEHGGPLIEQRTPMFNLCQGKIRAEVLDGIGMGGTYLIAACRAIVAAHQPSGYVEVPDELVEGE